MKKVIVGMLLTLICSNLSAQEPLTFSEVIQQEGKSSVELYKSVKKWFVHTFVSAQDVIQYDDSGNEITGKARIAYDCRNLTWAASSGFISYMVDVQIREGRLKISISDFVHQSTDLRNGPRWSNGLIYKELPSDDQLKAIGHGGIAKKQYKAIDERVRPLCIREAANLIASLKNHLEQAEQAKDEDW